MPSWFATKQVKHPESAQTHLKSQDEDSRGWASWHELIPIHKNARIHRWWHYRRCLHAFHVCWHSCVENRSIDRINNCLKGTKDVSVSIWGSPVHSNGSQLSQGSWNVLFLLNFYFCCWCSCFLQNCALIIPNQTSFRQTLHFFYACFAPYVYKFIKQKAHETGKSKHRRSSVMARSTFLWVSETKSRLFVE